MSYEPHDSFYSYGPFPPVAGSTGNIFYRLSEMLTRE